VETLKEPNLPDEDVHILLPTQQIDLLRTVSERYKSLSDRLVVKANMAGELVLRVETDTVKVETKWTNLTNPPLSLPALTPLTADPAAVGVETHPSTRRPRMDFSSIRISAKDWSNMLKVGVSATRMLACRADWCSV
jgi:HUS1 checkpoint protein